MSFLENIWQDLKSRKLLPVAAVLLVAIIAVPIVLTSSSSTPAPAAPSSPSGVAAAGLPAVSETPIPSRAPKGHARDPFAPASGAGGGQSKTSTTTTSTTSPAGTSTTSSTGSQGSSSTGTTTSTTTTPTGGTSPNSPSGGATGSTGSTGPTPKPKPTTSTLSGDQSYDVSLAVTNTSGGINTINPLERLSLLPSPNEPMLVELGVLKGGSRVLFAVQPGSVLSGPGSCVPGPVDCQILSVAQNQTESLSLQTASGTNRVAMFAVTAIKTVKHASSSAAMKARQQESAAGRQVLDHSDLSALGLFRYEPSVGAVVDLRNLTAKDT
jgi:hypothetical protein